MTLIEEEIKYGNDWWKEESRNKVGVGKDDLYRVTLLLRVFNAWYAT